MKFKAFFIYIAVGAAFLAASLWVILSGGKNAKAVRTKYKLGGILLTTWAMLSAGTCNGPIPTVSCYDPIEPPMCYDVAMPVNSVNLESTTLKRGEDFKITIQEPYFESLVAIIKDLDGKELQKESFIYKEETPWEYIFKVSGTLPVGNAVLEIQTITGSGEGGEQQVEVVFTGEVTIE